MHRNLGQVRLLKKTQDAVAWMEIFFSRIGDHMPDCDRIHLPSFLTKRDVFERMCSEMKQSGLRDQDLVSQSQFYAMWEKHYHHVQFPEVS